MKSRKLSSGPAVTGQCLCGAVQFEMEYPAFWAWHDHSRGSRLAHGAVYATYVGTWRKRFRFTAGEREIMRGRSASCSRTSPQDSLGIIGADRRKADAFGDAEMQALDITGDAFHPEWNYSIKPRRLTTSQLSLMTS